MEFFLSIWGGLVAIARSIPAVLNFLYAIGSLIRTAWQVYRQHLIDVASKEAAAKLKQSSIDARSGDTSDLENWFSPGRNKKEDINANVETQPDTQPKP